MSENIGKLQRQEPTLMDIVGFIKVNESIAERIITLIACIRSFAPVKGWGRFILCLDQPSEWLFNLVEQELKEFQFDYELTRTFEGDSLENYGTRYLHLLQTCRTEYVLNFMEDQFLMCSDRTLNMTLNAMGLQECDMMKDTFFEVEKRSVDLLSDKTEDTYGYYYINDQARNNELQKLWHRYYIGVNFITTLDFAKKFWGRYPDEEYQQTLRSRPHEYELAYYSKHWEHKVMVPKAEIMAAIDDDHGVPGSALIHRREEEKFKAIMINMVTNEERYTKSKPAIGLFHINNYEIKTEKLGNHLHGSIVRQFEQNFCRYVGAKYGCSVNSATSAIVMLFENAQVVRVPSMLPPVVVNALLNAGNGVWFEDNVDWVGWSYHMALQGDEPYKVIDSAQRVDRNQYFEEATSEDDILFFSHYPTKPVGGIDGGMIVSNNKDHIDYYRAMSLNGMNYKENNWERTQQYVGHKMYMNAVQAYVANENLKKLDAKKKRLAEIRNIYNASGIGRSDQRSDHLYRIEVGQRSVFLRNMAKVGIVCGIHYDGCHLHPLFEAIPRPMDMSKTEKLNGRTVSIPFHERLSDEDVQAVINAVKMLSYAKEK